MMRKTIRAALVALVFAAPALGQTAGMLSFQGLIKDSVGDPVTGAIDLQFRIYNDPVSTSGLVDMDGDGAIENVVGEDAKEVLGLTTSAGIVSTKFGPVLPSAFDGLDRWLEVSVRIPAGVGVFEALSRIEMATAPAAAEQLNSPASGAAAAVTDDKGNVGIGTATPSARLHATGASPIGGTGSIARTPGTTPVTGSGTAFLTKLHVGDTLVSSIPPTQKRVIVEILSDILLTVESPFVPELAAQVFSFQQPIARLADSAGQTVFRVDAQGAGLGIVPVGSIIAWHKDLGGGGVVPALPSGWLECDGSTVSDPESPLDGQTLPDLNTMPTGYTGGG